MRRWLRQNANMIAEAYQGGFVLRDIGMNLAAVRLRDLDDMVADPLCWFVIGGPAVLLAIAALYFYSKARRLTKGETKRNMFDRTGRRRR